jgi:hypothetical protein
MDHYFVDVHITNKRPMAQLAIRVFTLILSEYIPFVFTTHYYQLNNIYSLNSYTQHVIIILNIK